MAKKYFKEAGIEHQLNYHLGNAIEIIPGINEVFDLVFIDADKDNYLNYYNLVFDKVKPGGYFFFMNPLVFRQIKAQCFQFVSIIPALT